MSDIRIAILGAAGRMGRALIQQVTETDGCVLAGGTEGPGHPKLGQDLGALAGIDAAGIPLTDDPLTLITQSDAIIDFTIPAATVEHAGLAAQGRIVHVIGTTGTTAEDDEKIRAAARHATIIRAGNFSLGVNLVAALTRRVAATLDADFDIEIVEMHHRHKVDAPSGTALMFGEAAAEGRRVDLNHVSDRGRDGQTGARKRGDIGFAALRGGSVVGDHSVIFAGEKERVVLSHVAEDRAIFANGAVAAAKWGVGKGPGFFSMADVLGLTE